LWVVGYDELNEFKQGDKNLDTAVLWQTELGEIELGVSQGNFVTWFKNTRLLKIDENTVVIGAPNIFIKQQLEKRFNELITETLEKNGIVARAVEYKILPASPLHRRVEEQPIILSEQMRKADDTRSGSTTRTSSLTHSYRHGLNEKYTFENFI